MAGAGVERAELEARYRQLVLRDLPERGRAERWVVHAEQVAAEGDPLLRRLNDQSLAWRGKLPRS